MICSVIYVDNIISGCETEQRAADYYSQARTIMGEARLNLRSWSSNSAKLTTIASKENTMEKATIVNILGLRWNPINKLHLSEKSSILAHGHLTMKREVLQDLSKIFDPLGFVAPVMIRAKILMQKLWQLKITWDDRWTMFC